MIKSVYFDRNVFDYIRRRRITDGDLQVLRAIIRLGEFSILLSVTLLEEALILLKTSSDIAKEEWQLLASLTRGSKVIKHHQELLRDDILSYAKGWPTPSPFTAEFDDLIKYLNPDEPDLAGRLAVVAEVEQAKNEVQSNLQVAKNHDSTYFGTLPKGSRPDFKKYYCNHALRVASDFAQKVGVLAECKAKGLEGLLQIKSVQLCVGAHLSLGYAQTREGQAVSPGDWHDMQHAVLASAADAFVTQDKKLSKNLNRLGIKDLEVINLQTLLQRIFEHYHAQPTFA